MNRNIELCWNITSECNQCCRYCHRFLNIKKLDFENNKKILQMLHTSGIKKITWTGGEALILPYLDDLLKLSCGMGIENKLITNGILLTESRLKKIYPYLNIVTLSIDSTDPEINKMIGRGENHFNIIKERIELLNKYGVKYSINTVLNKLNINDIYKFSEFIADKNPAEWRIFKFLPLRGTSLKTKDIFDISQDEYDKMVNGIRIAHPKINIVTRQIKDFEKLYLLILANGDVFVTQNASDKRLGNLLEQSFEEIINGEIK